MPPIRLPAKNSSSSPICRARRRTPASSRLRRFRKRISALSLGERIEQTQGDAVRPGEARRAGSRNRTAGRDRAWRAPAAGADRCRCGSRDHRCAARARAGAAAMGQGNRDAAPSAGLAASRARRALARYVGCRADRIAGRLAAAVPVGGILLRAHRSRRIAFRPDVAGAARIAAQDRQPGADPLRRAVGKPRADPLRRRNAGAGDPRAGAVRPRPASGDRRRHRAADAGAAVAGASADPDDARPAGFLARLVGGCALGHARTLSQACLARRSAGRRPPPAAPSRASNSAWRRPTGRRISRPCRNFACPTSRPATGSG